MKQLRNSIIVPAHNEEAVIRRTLETLLKDALPGEFEVLVVCNGCEDKTARNAESVSHDVTAIELAQPSKTLAINEGLRAATGDSVLLLDADIELSTADARKLLKAATRPGKEVAIAHMDIDTEGADIFVRSFYKIWKEHPYLRNGKFAAAIALSASGIARIGSLPAVTADDTYLKRLFPKDTIAVANGVRFTARAPRTVGSLIKVRSRSYRGTRQLDSHISERKSSKSEGASFARSIIFMPRLWIEVPAYLAVTLLSRFLSYKTSGVRWERDMTTRNTTSD